MDTKYSSGGDNAGYRETVDTYFGLIRRLRAGDVEAVDALMDLWDEDGLFEFAGAPPVVGSFKGAMAIRTLYKNRALSHRMGIRVGTEGGEPRDLELGLVDTEVTHLREDKRRAVAGWRTTIGTREGLGFDVAGAHRFVFTDSGKIASLKVSVSPKADQSVVENLRAEELSVTDVGRLSLAAWPVV